MRALDWAATVVDAAPGVDMGALWKQSRDSRIWSNAHTLRDKLGGTTARPM